MNGNFIPLTREEFDELPENAKRAYEIAQRWWIIHHDLYDCYKRCWIKLEEEILEAMIILKETKLPKINGAMCSDLYIPSLIRDIAA